MRTNNFQMSKLALEKEEELEVKLPTFTGSQRKLGNTRKTSTSVSSVMLKHLTVYHNKLWKAVRVMGILDHLTCFLRNLYVSQEATIKTEMEPVQNCERSTTRLYMVTLLI